MSLQRHFLFSLLFITCLLSLENLQGSCEGPLLFSFPLQKTALSPDLFLKEFETLAASFDPAEMSQKIARIEKRLTENGVLFDRSAQDIEIKSAAIRAFLREDPEGKDPHEKLVSIRDIIVGLMQYEVETPEECPVWVRISQWFWVEPYILGAVETTLLDRLQNSIITENPKLHWTLYGARVVLKNLNSYKKEVSETHKKVLGDLEKNLQEKIQGFINKGSQNELLRKCGFSPEEISYYGGSREERPLSFVTAE